MFYIFFLQLKKSNLKNCNCMMETIVYGEDAEGIKKVSRVKNHSSCLFQWSWDSSRSSGPKRVKCSGGNNHRRAESSSERVYYFIRVHECQTKVAPSSAMNEASTACFQRAQWLSASQSHHPPTHYTSRVEHFPCFTPWLPDEIFLHTHTPHTPDLWNVNGIFKKNFHSIKINVIKLIPYIYL